MNTIAAEVRPSVYEGLKARAGLIENRRELEMFTLIVSGSSRQCDAEVVWNPLFWMLARHEQMIVRYTAPTRPDRGVEAFVQRWCRLPGQPWNIDPRTKYLVLEEPFGDTAEMVAAGQASACYAFPDDRRKSRTLLCMALAWARGIPVYCFSSFRVGRFHELSEGEGLDLAKRMLGWGS